jgi:hypothetical protein
MVWVWNGTGYTSVDLSTAVSQTWAIPTTTVAYGGGISMTYEGSLTVQQATTLQTPAVRTGVVTTDCKATACTTTVDGSHSVTAAITVVVAQGGTELTRFEVAIDLGGLTASSSYKVAANA